MRPTCWCFNVAFDISKVVLRKLVGNRLMVDQSYSLLLVVPSKPGDDAFHWIMLVDKSWQIFTAKWHPNSQTNCLIHRLTPHDPQRKPAAPLTRWCHSAPGPEQSQSLCKLNGRVSLQACSGMTTLAINLRSRHSHLTPWPLQEPHEASCYSVFIYFICFNLTYLINMYMVIFL